MPELTYTLTEAEYMALRRRDNEAFRLHCKVNEQNAIIDDLNDRIGSLGDEATEASADAERLGRKYERVISLMSDIISNAKDRAEKLMHDPTKSFAEVATVREHHLALMRDMGRFEEIIMDEGMEPGDVLHVTEGTGDFDDFFNALFATQEAA